MIDELVSRWSDEYRTEAEPLIERIRELLRDGVTIQLAVDMAFDETGFTGAIASELRQSIAQAAGAGFGSVTLNKAQQVVIAGILEQKPWAADGLKLSDRLHGSDAQMRRRITQEVELAIKRGTNVVELSRRLFDGYGFPEVLNRAELPDYLKNIIGASRSGVDPSTDRELRKIIATAQRQIERLSVGGAPTAALKASYQKLFNAAISGSARAIDKAIEVAVNEKSRYIAERIARTEMSRAWSEGFWAKQYTDDLVVAVRWRLGSRHPRFDICDFHARADLYGMGPGIYPKTQNPPHPAHPHCTCRLLPVYEGEVGPPRPMVKDGGDDFLRSLKPDEREALLTQAGAKAWRQGKDWQGELRNWNGHRDPNPALTKANFTPPPAPPVTTPPIKPTPAPARASIDADLPKVPQARRDQLRKDYDAAPPAMQRIIQRLATGTGYAEVSAGTNSHYSWNKAVNMSLARQGDEYNRTFWHELGHAVDHQLALLKGVGPFTLGSGSSQVTGMEKAIRADVDKFRKLTYNELTKKTPKALAKQIMREKVAAGVSYSNAPFRNNAGVSDIFSSATKNDLRGAWGHSTGYLKRAGAGSGEVFANLWQLYLQNDTAAIAFLKETMPQTVAEFEKIIAEHGGV